MNKAIIDAIKWARERAPLAFVLGMAAAVLYGALMLHQHGHDQGISDFLAGAEWSKGQ